MLEKQSVEINLEVIEAFKDVRTELDGIETCIEGLEISCKDLTSRLREARNTTAMLIQETEQLQREQQQVLTKKAEIEVFLKKYFLSPEQQAVLEEKK
eukprot:g12148.t1